MVINNLIANKCNFNICLTAKNGLAAGEDKKRNDLMDKSINYLSEDLPHQLWTPW